MRTIISDPVGESPRTSTERKQGIYSQIERYKNPTYKYDYLARAKSGVYSTKKHDEMVKKED